MDLYLDIWFLYLRFWLVVLVNQSMSTQNMVFMLKIYPEKGSELQ